MGSYWSFLPMSWFSNKEARILILGLDNAGKTKLLYRLIGEDIETMVTMGFNVEKVQYKKLNITAWDVGGRDRVRALWRFDF